MRFRTVVIWNGISTLGQSGITLLSTMILARLLTPDDFGIVGIVTIFMAFSQMMVDSEMGGALLRKKEVSKVDYSTLFYYNLAVSVLLYLLLFFTAPLIAKFYHRPPLIEIIRLLSFTIIIHAFRVVQKIMIFRDLKFKTFALINVLSGVVSLVCAIVLASNGYGYWSLVWQQLVLAICNVIFMAYVNRFTPSLAFSKESFKYQFSFGINLLGSDFLNTIANNLSTNIIAKVGTLQLTGYYTQSNRLTNFGQNLIGTLLDQSVFPMLSKMEEKASIRHTYHKILLYMCLGLGLISLIGFLWAEEIVKIVLGKEWIGAVSIFQLLILTLVPVGIQRLCRNIMKTVGSTRTVFIIEMVKSALIILALFCGMVYGVMGIIYGLLLSQVLSGGIWLYITERNFNSPGDGHASQGLASPSV